MTAERIDGKAFAAALRERVGEQAAKFSAAAGRKAGLAVVLVGEDPASQVLRIGVINLPHGLGISEVEGVERFRVSRRRRRKPWRESGDQVALERRRVDGSFLCSLQSAVGDIEHARHVLGIEEAPRLVVIGPRRERDAPMRHRALRIILNGLFEASDRFFGVEDIGPQQATVEPELCLR